MSATVVLADDHRIVRQGLRALLEAQSDLRVIAETGDGLEAVELVERLRPDVLVVDVMMPGLNGLEVTRLVRQRWPATKVVVLSMRAGKPFSDMRPKSISVCGHRSRTSKMNGTPKRRARIAPEHAAKG